MIALTPDVCGVRPDFAGAIFDIEPFDVAAGFLDFIRKSHIEETRYQFDDMTEYGPRLMIAGTCVTTFHVSGEPRELWHMMRPTDDKTGVHLWWGWAGLRKPVYP